MKRLDAVQVAEKVNGSLKGDETVIVTGVESLTMATSEHVSFLSDSRYKDYLKTSQAGIVLVSEESREEPPDNTAYILCEDPSMAFDKIVAMFAPPEVKLADGIDGSAVISDDAELADDVSVGPCAVIRAGAAIAEGTVIGGGAYVGQESVIGRNCKLYPNVTIRERCVLADNVIIHSGTEIGSDGFGYIPGKTEHQKIPQTGIVQIDDDVEIGSQVAIDRARFGKTWIKRGVKIDNLVQIAHNVVIDELSFIVAHVAIAGSSHIGRRVSVAGQVGVAGHLKIGDDSLIMAQSGISKDVPEKSVMMGTPAVDRKEFARNKSDIKKIGRLNARIKELQQQLEILEKKVAELEQ